MLKIHKFDSIYFFIPPVDFRKGINGLSSFIQDQMQLDPFSNYLFIFINRQKNKIKSIYYDRNGFAMWVKHLIGDKYFWPSHLDEEIVKVDPRKFQRLLSGLNPFQQPFDKKNFKFL